MPTLPETSGILSPKVSGVVPLGEFLLPHPVLPRLVVIRAVSFLSVTDGQLTYPGPDQSVLLRSRRVIIRIRSVVPPQHRDILQSTVLAHLPHRLSALIRGRIRSATIRVRPLQRYSPLVPARVLPVSLSSIVNRSTPDRPELRLYPLLVLSRPYNFLPPSGP